MTNLLPLIVVVIVLTSFHKTGNGFHISYTKTRKDTSRHRNHEKGEINGPVQHQPNATTSHNALSIDAIAPEIAHGKESIDFGEYNLSDKDNVEMVKRSGDSSLPVNENVDGHVHELSGNSGGSDVQLSNTSHSDVIGSPVLMNNDNDKNQEHNETSNGVVDNNREESLLPHPNQLPVVAPENSRQHEVDPDHEYSSNEQGRGHEPENSRNENADIPSTTITPEIPERMVVPLPTSDTETHNFVTEAVIVPEHSNSNGDGGDKITESLVTELRAQTLPSDKSIAITDVNPAEVPNHEEHIKWSGTEPHRNNVRYDGVVTEPHHFNADSFTTEEPPRHLPDIDPGSGTYVESTDEPPKEGSVEHLETSTINESSTKVLTELVPVVTIPIPKERVTAIPPETLPIGNDTEHIINTANEKTTNYPTTYQNHEVNGDSEENTSIFDRLSSLSQETPLSTERQRKKLPTTSVEDITTFKSTSQYENILNEGTPSNINEITESENAFTLTNSVQSVEKILSGSTEKPAETTTIKSVELPSSTYGINDNYTTKSLLVSPLAETSREITAKKHHSLSTNRPYSRHTFSTDDHIRSVAQSTKYISSISTRILPTHLTHTTPSKESIVTSSVQATLSEFNFSKTINDKPLSSSTKRSSTEREQHQSSSSPLITFRGDNKTVQSSSPSHITTASRSTNTPETPVIRTNIWHSTDSRPANVTKKRTTTQKVEQKLTEPNPIRPTTSKQHEHMLTPAPFIPPVFIRIQIRMPMSEFCVEKSNFITTLMEIIEKETSRKLEDDQIVFLNSQEISCLPTYDEIMPPSKMDNEETKIDLYIIDVKGEIDVTLTVHFEKIIEPGFKTMQSHFSGKLVDVKLVQQKNNEDKKEEDKHKSKPSLGSGITIAIVIASVGGFCCLSLLILQTIIHKRHGKRLSAVSSGSSRLSMRSMDSIALGVVPKSRPHSGFWNAGLDYEEQTTSKELSHPLGYTSLSNFTLDTKGMEHEFEKLPYEMPSLSCVPVGAEDKNRFANVIPYPHTRVKLKRLNDDENSDYINANFVTGYDGNYKSYIATQAPMTNTMKDFWRMVWEQQSRVILMVTPMDERGQPRCPPYWPEVEGMNGRLQFGDFTILLKKQDIHQEYITSVLEIKDIENNLLREIRHFWFTCWPCDGSPEPISIIKFILDTRVHYEDSGAPVIVHCSPGTGRTGTLIAIDICMRSYERKRMVDVLNTVYLMRQERAGTVQTKDQYTLIYKSAYEYSVIMSSPSISTASSAIALHNML